jgi:hypothetical protein
MATSGAETLVDRHLRVGWWAILLFLCLGVTLEAMHAFKVGLYLAVDMEARRLMWTLAHAHGTLFGLLNIAFAATARLKPEWAAHSGTLASRCLLAALVLVPSGFFLGGTFVHAGDPGVGVWLVPPGALALFVAVLSTSLGIRAAAR